MKRTYATLKHRYAIEGTANGRRSNLMIESDTLRLSFCSDDDLPRFVQLVSPVSAATLNATRMPQRVDHP